MENYYHVNLLSLTEIILLKVGSYFLEGTKYPQELKGFQVKLLWLKKKKTYSGSHNLKAEYKAVFHFST